LFRVNSPVCCVIGACGTTRYSGAPAALPTGLFTSEEVGGVVVGCGPRALPTGLFASEEVGGVVVGCGPRALPTGLFTAEEVGGDGYVGRGLAPAAGSWQQRVVMV